MRIERHGRRFWRVEEEDGTLICVTVYRKGAREVARRLSGPRELPALAAHASRHPLTADGPAGTIRANETRKKGEQ